MLEARRHGAHADGAAAAAIDVGEIERVLFAVVARAPLNTGARWRFGVPRDRWWRRSITGRGGGVKLPDWSSLVRFKGAAREIVRR